MGISEYSDSFFQRVSSRSPLWLSVLLCLLSVVEAEFFSSTLSSADSNKIIKVVAYREILQEVWLGT